MRKVFLHDLPRKRGIRGLKNKIVFDWDKIAELKCKVKFIYEGVEGEVEIVGYQKKGSILYVKYLDNEPLKISTVNFRNAAIGRIIEKRTNEFKIEFGKHFKDENRDITIIDREYRYRINSKRNDKWYKYKCNKCGYNEGWAIEHSLLTQGTGCSCCCGYTPFLGINTIWDTDRWMCDLGVSEEDAKKYTRGNSSEKITVICPNCKKEKEMFIKNLYNRRSIGCSTCGDGFSYGHKYVHNLLLQLNKKFEDNEKFHWCKFYNKFKEKETTGEYDFIIEDLKLIIEVDGRFHREDNNMSGQSKEESKYLDDMKDLLAQENGYNIVRIYYDDHNFIIKENIINSELMQIFDLNNIDWDKCENFALSNICKEVCELKRNNPNLTVADIHEKTKLGRTTIRRYLNKGTKLGWCNYNGKEESSRSSRKTGKMSGKQVEVFKDGMLLGVFKSAMELERQSEELFGVRLLNSCISLVCNGKTSHHKGFTFKYVEK